MLTRANLATNALTLAQAWRFTANDVLLHALPIFHVHGLFVAINTVLASGCSMLFLSKFDADEVVRLLPEATVMMGVPTFYTRLLQHPALHARSCREHAIVRVRLGTAARGNASRVSRAHRARDSRTLRHERDAHEHVQSLRRRARRRLGRPAAARRAKFASPIPSPACRCPKPETVGMIEVRGPNVFRGYWRMPEKTAAEFREDGFFITGDVGRFDRQRLPVHRRARQGPDHQRRLQRLSRSRSRPSSTR